MLQTIWACADEVEDESNLLEWLERNTFSNSARAAPSTTNSIADRIEEYEHAITAIQLAEILQSSRREIYKLVE